MGSETTRLVIFDAAGTLFRPVEPVGVTYGRYAEKHGAAADPEHLEKQFRKLFGQQPALAFRAGLTESELRQTEYEWWRRLVREVFDQREFDRFDAFFDDVFEHYRRPSAWVVYDDVIPVLKRLRSTGMKTAVVSNFDSRLIDLLAGLGLRDYFDYLGISSRDGAAKPDPLIFRLALEQLGVGAEQAVHVGDSLREDVEGARAAGVFPLLLDRSGAIPDNDRLTVIQDLHQLFDHLQY
ncbi:MAG: HAD-IA family hydrolase [Blastocatellales bacterium]